MSNTTTAEGGTDTSKPTDTPAADAAAGTPAAGAAADGKAAADAAAAASTSGDGTTVADAATGTGDGKGAAPAAGDKNTPAGAPENYTLALPEGGPLDDSDLASFADYARTRNWTNEQAQAELAAQSDALKAQSARFLAETTSHTEIGGTNLAAAQVAARAAMDKLLPPESPEGVAFRRGLDKTGYGNWAPLLLLLSRAGKAFAEDRPIHTDTSAAPGARDHASVLYGG